MPNDGSTKKVCSKEINGWPSFHLDIALIPSPASKSHGFVIADVGQTGEWVRNGRRQRRPELDLFAKSHAVRVFSTLSDVDATGATQTKPMTIENGIQRSTKAIEAII